MRAEMGWGAVEAGQRKGKWPQSFFFFGIPFPCKFFIWSENKLERYT
jgi:hypothetical protein